MFVLKTKEVFFYKNVDSFRQLSHFYNRIARFFIVEFKT